MSKIPSAAPPFREGHTVSPAPSVQPKQQQHFVVRQKDDGCCLWNLVKAFFSMIGEALSCLFCCDSGQKGSLPNRTQQTLAPQATAPQKKTAAVARRSISEPTKSSPVYQSTGAPPPSHSTPSSPRQPVDSAFADPLIAKPSSSSSPPQAPPLGNESSFDLGISPSETIEGITNQNDQKGGNSCTFTSLAFLESMTQSPYQLITSKLIDQAVVKGIEQYHLHDGEITKGKQGLYEASEIPTEIYFPGLIRADEGSPERFNGGLVAGGQAPETYLNLMRQLPEKNGQRSAVFTIRSESCAIFIRNDGKVFLFNSHATQLGKPSNATVKIFENPEHLANFLGAFYPYEEKAHLEIPDNSSKVAQYAEFLSKQPAFANRNPLGITVPEMRALLVQQFPNDQGYEDASQFTTKVLEEIQLQIITQSDAISSRASQWTINEFTMLPYGQVVTSQG